MQDRVKEIKHFVECHCSNTNNESDARIVINISNGDQYAAPSSLQSIVDSLIGSDFRLFIVDPDTSSWAETKSPRIMKAPTQIFCTNTHRTITACFLLHSSRLSSGGGAVRSHLSNVEELVRRGGFVHTLVASKNLIEADLADALISAGSSFSYVGDLPWWYGTDTIINAYSPAVTEEIKGIDPDIVISQVGVLPQAALSSAVAGKPHVWYIREFGDLDYGWSLPAEPHMLGRIFSELSSICIANSSAIREYFFEESISNVVTVNPWFVTPQQTSIRSADTAASSKTFTFGVVGFIHAGKGQRDVVSAIAEARNLGYSFRVLFFGDCLESEFMYLKSLMHALGIETQIQWMGSDKDVSRIYASIDAVVVSSRNEAYGRVPMEAASFSVPIIYTMAGGLLDFMEHYVNGLGYYPGDIETLAKNMIQIYQSDDLRAALTERAKDLICPNALEKKKNQFISALNRSRTEYFPTPAQVLVKIICNSPANLSVTALPAPYQAPRTFYLRCRILIKNLFYRFKQKIRLFWR
ncbi:glycosyltransferase family 4 protein [Cyanobium gracile]|uniref:Glycosyltransferase family 4 protein n=1 Tax=Cyanobium gracile UHCC 0281 TaxID=3110309 RepID=A0ABU5STS8_9CYAN|nr:glycosyltransferase family 4 protein [Cyanobium gracile]MEA5441885.1 glycosyltransferase family 4 protein [Cyanobium gracile UHCC 0281]